MNNKELGIFICLNNTPDTLRMTEDGKSVYVLVYGSLVRLDGEGLDKMSPQELCDFIDKGVYEYKCAM